jgi:transcriptional regulator with XRE-family HTH domain
MVLDRNRRSTEEWERFVGSEIRATRIAANLDQAALSELAGVSLGALKNLETGKGSSLKTLIRVVRALDRPEWLESLAPPITVSPIDMLSRRRSREHPRQRVSRHGSTARERFREGGWRIDPSTS